MRCNGRGHGRGYRPGVGRANVICGSPTASTGFLRPGLERCTGKTATFQLLDPDWRRMQRDRRSSEALGNNDDPRCPARAGQGQAIFASTDVVRQPGPSGSRGAKYPQTRRRNDCRSDRYQDPSPLVTTLQRPSASGHRRASGARSTRDALNEPGSGAVRSVQAWDVPIGRRDGGSPGVVQRCSDRARPSREHAGIRFRTVPPHGRPWRIPSSG